MSAGQEVKLKVRQVIREAQNVIANPKEEEELRQALQSVRVLLPHTQTDGASHHFTEDCLEEARREFLQNMYGQFLETLTQHINIDWMKKLPKGQTAELLDVFFLQGHPHEAFIVLCHAITNNSPGYRINKCASLLETFIRSHGLGSIIWDQCQMTPRTTHQDESQGRRSRVDAVTQQTWEELVTLMATLPDRVTAKLKQETSDIFFPDTYIPLLAGAMFDAMKKVHTRLNQSQDCSVQFLSQLIGKLCITGYGEKLWSALLPTLVPLVSKDFVWCRICEKLVSSVPDRCLESVVLPIIKLSPWHGTVSRILGQTVLSSQKLSFLLTHKLILLRHFEQDLIPQNIIGYLATSPAMNHLYIKVLLTVLDVWGDRSALKHTSYEQHRYITKVILICLAFMQEKDCKQHKEELLQKLMQGVQCHLDSSEVRVRQLGMMTAEAVTKTVDPQGHKLQFEYEKNQEMAQLWNLLQKPEDPGISYLESKLDGVHVEEELSDSQTTDKKLPSTSEVKHAVVTSGGDSDLDSDDDLEPYDLSNDTKVNKVKPPVYVRDCMEGLLSSDDPDRVEACLLAAENLIRNHPSTVKEIAAEFAKILVHLEDKYALPCYLMSHHRALVALAVTAPVQVAEYLTGQFYERNYNIRQRLDILQVLSGAAQELSQPSDSSAKKGSSKHDVTMIEAAELPGDSQDWRQIVQKRIDSKTRRFVHGRSKPEPTPVKNQFAPVAGHFFFPLLANFDKNEGHLDLLGSDHIVLTRLTYTLGVIMYAATHAPVAKQMGTSLLQFIWALRYHPEPSVRQALLYALSMVLLALPSYVLLSELQADMMEAKQWLEDVVEGDTDNECKQLAVQSLVLLENNIKEEFEANKPR